MEERLLPNAPASRGTPFLGLRLALGALAVVGAFVGSVALSLSPGAAPAPPAWLSVPASVYDLFASQANATMAQIGDRYDQYPTVGSAGGGPWQLADRMPWTAGFFPGGLWTLAGMPRPDAGWFGGQAALFNLALALDSSRTDTHDVGFMLLPAVVPQAALGNASAAAAAARTLEAGAHSLARRFSPVVNCTRSWGALAPAPGDPDATAFRVIIDNMLNLELLDRVGTATGNATLLDMSTRHADRMLGAIFQADKPGCVFHLLTFSPETGSLLSASSQPQGLGPTSVWARGQAWALLGFARAAALLRAPRYLAAARSAAGCFVRLAQETRAEGVAPLWDFFAEAPQAALDTSAGAVAALGMLEVAAALTAPAEEPARRFHLAAAKALLDDLLARHLAAPAATDAVLANGTSTFPEAGVALPYGDYYLLGACLRWDEMPIGWRLAATEDLAASGWWGLDATQA